MKRTQLKATRLTELALKLALLSSRSAPERVEVQFHEFERALRWHRWSCRPVQLARRIAQALISNRVSECRELIAKQKAMLSMAASETPGSDESVLHALINLSTALVRYELGPDSTPKERLAFEAADMPLVRQRFASLVRHGELEASLEGLKLLRAKHRRLEAYGAAALLAAWPSLLFIVASIEGFLNPDDLVAYIAGSVLMSALLTRPLFTELRADERTVEDLSSQLKPRAVPGKQPGK